MCLVCYCFVYYGRYKKVGTFIFKFYWWFSKNLIYFCNFKILATVFFLTWPKTHLLIGPHSKLNISKVSKVLAVLIFELLSCDLSIIKLGFVYQQSSNRIEITSLLISNLVLASLTHCFFHTLTTWKNCRCLNRISVINMVGVILE